MSNSVIEDGRQTAEEIDIFERALAQHLASLSTPNLTHRDKLSTSHRAANLVDRIVQRTQSLTQSLAPTNEERIVEIDALTGGGQGGDLSEFYQRLAKIKEYHRKYPDAANAKVSGDRQVDFAALEGGDDEWLDKRFTGEEGLGRYIDVHELHEAWNNLSPASTSGAASGGGWKRMTYLQYLSALTAFTLSPALKSTPQYSKYLTDLLSYLSNFHEKVFPLADLDKVLHEADVAFATKWELGQVEGWPREEDTVVEEGAGIWCAACTLLTVLFACSSRKANPSGRITPSSGQKLYSKQTVYTAHLTSKKHLKSAAKLTDASSASSPDPTTAAPTSSTLSHLRRQKNRALALKEALITSLVGTPSSPLSNILTETRNNTERRAALTDKERAAEIDELEAREAAEASAAAAAAQAKGAAAGLSADDDDDDGRIYNPLRLPLGWDGKPIPFWLYKLHGLGVEYKCEICSDFVYMGRKVFERHFQESRHAFGMRALGLPNTKHFHEITRIEDAIALAEKLKQEGKQEMFAAELTEELEDSEGNVYNRKTWDDLKRQGLL
ncbi:splicing factor 3A subunit 3, partial [Phenoliferia sp. Uapishka_3]